MRLIRTCLYSISNSNSQRQDFSKLLVGENDVACYRALVSSIFIKYGITIPFRFQRITGNTLRFAGLFNLPIPPRSAFRIGVSTITRQQGGGEEAYC